ncbi:MAG TPA: hypothetical protein VNN73_03890 [Blastocatellia bacterium]|nr:hypothetical protein [Blastocatellia bacterium]
MNNRIYDDELLTQYLLGQLPEREAERLDELSFTDAAMAARLQAIENDLVDAYARGKIADATLERFNSYYLASPKRREKAAFARGLQRFKLDNEKMNCARTPFHLRSFIQSRECDNLLSQR